VLKDRAQKAQALRLCVSKSWMPQLEVNVEPSRRLEKTKYLLTDLDVLAIARNPIGEMTRLVFDCKSGPRESPIGRTFWLKGVMTKVGAAHGFILLNDRINISRDHRASAAELSVTLLRESEVTALDKGLGGRPVSTDVPIADIDAWEQFFSIEQKYPSVTDFSAFARSTFWMLKDPGERCRKCVGKLRAIHSELDPSKAEHLAIFGEALALFILAIADLTNRLFLVLIKPVSEEEFTTTLLALLYGGYDNLEVALKIRRITAGAAVDDHIDIFPEMRKFEHLMREMLEAPFQALDAAICARDASLSVLIGSPASSLFKQLIELNQYSAKFIVLAADYLQKAARVPVEFKTYYVDLTLTVATEAMTKQKEVAKL
jgi:hypothetical protein